MASHRRPVLIVGAGPTGLAAALELARNGREVRIIDRAERRSRHSKAIGVNPRTLELLEPSGVTERLLAAGHLIRHLEFRTPERRLARVDLEHLRHRYPFMLALEQSETERILERSLAEQGVWVAWRTEFTRLEQDHGRVLATVAADGERQEIEAAYLIGADGAHSAVRDALGLEFAGETYPFEWWLVDVRMDAPLGRDEAQLVLRPDVLLVMIRIADDLFRLASNGADPLDLLPPGCTVREEIWRSSFRISYRQVATYRRGSVFLAGDAAHVHSPVGARGMNLGIEDATILARKMLSGDLDSYSAERHPVGARVIRETHLLTRIVTARRPLARWLRDHLTPFVLRLPAVQRQLVRRIAGLA